MESCKLVIDAVREIKKGIEEDHFRSQEKNDKITAAIYSIDKTLALQSKILDEHIRRTELIEEFMVKVDQRLEKLEVFRVKNEAFYRYLITFISMLLSILGIVVAYLGTK